MSIQDHSYSPTLPPSMGALRDYAHHLLDPGLTLDLRVDYLEALIWCRQKLAGDVHARAFEIAWDHLNEMSKRGNELARAALARIAADLEASGHA
jgi:hypothetical protein